MANNGDFSFVRTGSIGRHGLRKIQTHHESTEVCHDDSATPVKAKTIDELHSLQKKKSSQPTTPITGTRAPGSPFSAISEEDRQKQQLQSIR
jgi:phosphoenolpyruvate carboxykinase (ATP)